MKLSINELTINFSHLKPKELLTDWEWLIGIGYQPVLVTAFGDAFIQRQDSSDVSFLNTQDAELSIVAESIEQFKELLNSEDFVAKYFFAQPVVDLYAAGIRLTKGKIYSFKVPLVLGGEFGLNNIELADIEVHFSITGQIQEQVRNLPEGTLISDIKLKTGKRPWWKIWN